MALYVVQIHIRGHRTADEQLGALEIDGAMHKARLLNVVGGLAFFIGGKY